MDEEKVRKLKLEIEEINRVKDEGENLDTVDGFRKYIRKQIDKISGKSSKKTLGTSSNRLESAGSGRSDRGDRDGDPDVYDFSYPERGLAIIINNEDFTSTDKFGDRPGSTFDATALFDTFRNLGFKVWVKTDLTAWQMVEVLKHGRDYDHMSSDCFVCAILTHGSETFLNLENEKYGSLVRKDLLFGIDGKAVSTSTIVNIFSDGHCPKLKGKPRLFFIQACRGEDYDDGVDVAVSKLAVCGDQTGSRSQDRTDAGSSQEKLVANIHTDSISTPESFSLQEDNTDAKLGNKQMTGKRDKERSALTSEEVPQLTDMTDGPGAHVRNVPVCPAPLYIDSLIMYATPPGHYAWRRKNGAWFVQSLCSVLNSQEISNKSLLNALIQVTGKVAIEYQSENPSRLFMHQKKETPVVESMLVKDIFFVKKK